MDQPLEQYKPAEKLELKEIKKEFPKVFKTIHCPSCEEEVKADNLNLQSSLAKCSSCNVIFSIEEEVDSLKSEKEMKQKMKQEIIRPEGIDLFYYNNKLEISLKQTWQAVDVAGIIFLPILSFCSIILFLIKGIPVIFPIALTISALYFIFKAFKYSTYKNYIELSGNTLTIKSRPKNYQKDRIYSISDIDQLYVKLGPSGYYEVRMAINGSGGQKHEKLTTALTLSKAKYLEQEIETYLNIEDRKVIGEKV